MGLRTALSVKYAQGDLTIVDSFDMSSCKTKAFTSLMKLHNWNSVLLVDGDVVNANLCRATSNLPKVDVLPCKGANVYSILLRNKLVLSLGAVRLLEERLGGSLPFV
jgi:large subunit ribosomal protein L4